MMMKNLTGFALSAMIFMTGCGSSSGGSSSNDVTNDVDTSVVIDVMALYSPEANVFGDAETRIQHFIAVANEISNSSEINLKYRLVHAQEYINNAATSDETLDSVQSDIKISALRKQYKADEVVFYKPYSSTNDGYCGVGYLNLDLHREAAYAYVAIDCPSDVTAHELGHILGLGHTHRQKEEGIFPYSVGHGVDREFVTLMGYPEYFDTINIEMVYSNPTLDCQGFPCGVEIGLPEEADASESIRQTMKTVSMFY